MRSKERRPRKGEGGGKDDSDAHKKVSDHCPLHSL